MTQEIFEEKENVETMDMVDIESIHPNEDNVKLHTESQLIMIMTSIQTFGFNDPIGIDEDGMILEGHGRYEAAQKLGMDEVPVIHILGLSAKEKTLYMLAHNNLCTSTGYDDDAVADMKAHIATIENVSVGAIQSMKLDNSDNEPRRIELVDGHVKGKNLVNFPLTFDTQDDRDYFSSFMAGLKNSDNEGMESTSRFIEFVKANPITTKKKKRKR